MRSPEIGPLHWTPTLENTVLEILTECFHPKDGRANELQPSMRQIKEFSLQGCGSCIRVHCHWMRLNKDERISVGVAQRRSIFLNFSQARSPVQKQVASKSIEKVPSSTHGSSNIDLAHNPGLIRASPLLDLLRIVHTFLKSDVAQVDELLREVQRISVGDKRACQVYSIYLALYASTICI